MEQALGSPNMIQYLNARAADLLPRLELGQTNIIFNIPHLSILVLHIQGKPHQNIPLLLIQEIKRDIIYRQMDLSPSVQQVTALQ